MNTELLSPVTASVTPVNRPRRLRQSAVLRSLVRETRLSRDDLIYPLFVRAGSGEVRDIPSMPGHAQRSVDMLGEVIAELSHLGIKAVLLFGIPETKDAQGSGAWAPKGPVPQAIAAIHKVASDMLAIADVCLCEYTDHGHCGLLSNGSDPQVLNDATLELLARAAVTYAAAGADMVAPSAMMDGQVAALRQALDQGGYNHIPIMAYGAKFASAFYGPFRVAAESAPSIGDRQGYQMDPSNRREALREIQLDVDEGADLVMVKPALPYLDTIRDARERFDLPIVAYQVSGEYAMLKAAALNGWLEERRAVLESLTSIKRAGADIIITYYAKEVVTWLETP